MKVVTEVEIAGKSVPATIELEREEIVITITDARHPVRRVRVNAQVFLATMQAALAIQDAVTSVQPPVP
jgi:hypothetical protein